MHRQHVDDLRRVDASPIAAAEQVRSDRVAVRLVTDQNRAEVVAGVRIASLQDGLASSRPVRAARESDWDTFWVMRSRLHPLTILLALVAVSVSCTSNGSVPPHSVGVEQTASTLDALKQLGVRLAVDDFGTGYSSLTYLDRFPIDELKIDRSFVATMTTGPDQSALVRSILKLGETLHLETVAEGIEQADQLAELKTLGAGLGQGYYFAEPLSPDALSVFLASGRPIGSVGVERGAA